MSGAIGRAVEVLSMGGGLSVRREGCVAKTEEEKGGDSNGRIQLPVQATRPNARAMNRFCARTFPFFTQRTCPFRILCIAS